MKPLLEKLLSIPKSFWVSIHYFPLTEALKLPIMVRYNTCLLSVGGKIIIRDKSEGKILSFGFGGVGIFDKKYERSIWEINGTIELSGRVVFWSWQQAICWKRCSSIYWYKLQQHCRNDFGFTEAHCYWR